MKSDAHQCMNDADLHCNTERWNKTHLQTHWFWMIHIPLLWKGICGSVRLECQALGLIQQLHDMIFKYYPYIFWHVTVFCQLHILFSWFWSAFLGSMLTSWISDINEAWVLNIKSQRTKERLKIRFNLPASSPVCVYWYSYRDTQRWDLYPLDFVSNKNKTFP